jgi:hypothetical protein
VASLEDACRALVAAVDSAEPDPQRIQALAQQTMHAVSSASPAALRAVAPSLLALVEYPDPRVAGAVAMLLGCFVEVGMPPADLAGPLVARCKEALGLAQPFFQARETALRELAQNEDPAAEDRLADALLDRMPHEGITYYSLESLFLPAIACLTRDEELRAATRRDLDLVALARQYHLDVGKWFYQLLAGVGEAEWVVLSAIERSGFVVRVHEIVDNWVLQPLLANALVRAGVTGEVPPPQLVACLEGEGPQRLSGHATGQWELYTHAAIGSDGTLRESLMDDKIWNEGIPLDIPELDGMRVVVVGRQRVRRSWNACRSFAALGSRIELVRKMDDVETDEWFRRCAAAHTH